MPPAGWHALHRSGRRPRLRSRFSCCDGRCRTARAACGDQRRQHLAGAVQCGDRCAVAAFFSALHEIRMVIAPAQGTPLGLATVRAVLSYCGTPFSWWQAGRWQQVVGWAQPTRVHFAQLAPRLASPCDVPDHDLLPQRYPGVQTVEFRAALEVPFLQCCLAVIAWLRQRGVPLPMQRLADVFAKAGHWFDRFRDRPGRHARGAAWHPPYRRGGKPTVAAALGPHCSDAARPGNPLFRGHFTDSQNLPQANRCRSVRMPAWDCSRWPSSSGNLLRGKCALQWRKSMRRACSASRRTGFFVGAACA